MFYDIILRVSRILRYHFMIPSLVFYDITFWKYHPSNDKTDIISLLIQKLYILNVAQPLGTAGANEKWDFSQALLFQVVYSNLNDFLPMCTDII